MQTSCAWGEEQQLGHGEVVTKDLNASGTGRSLLPLNVGDILQDIFVEVQALGYKMIQVPCQKVLEDTAL